VVWMLDFKGLAAGVGHIRWPCPLENKPQDR
jgi:hypothetical protein